MSPAVAYVVLAAGSSTRMGFAKAVTALHGVTPLERIVALLAGRDAALVTSDALRERCAALAPQLRLAINPEPERGMASSLRCGLEASGDGTWIGVCLADKPFMRPETLAALERAAVNSGCDVAYPSNAGGETGHPVYFAPHLRPRLLALPDGDTLRNLRDDPLLRRLTIPCEDPGAFVDLDTPLDWRDADRRSQAE